MTVLTLGPTRQLSVVDPEGGGAVAGVATPPLIFKKEQSPAPAVVIDLVVTSC